MADDLTALDDEVHDVANLSEARTGVPGVIWISTQVARHGPLVKYFEKPGKGQPSFAVSIEETPKVVAGDLPERVIKRMSPEVMEWVNLNRAALLAFWNDGDTWMDEQVQAFKKALVRLP
jgi:hypothetical protein